MRAPGYVFRAMAGNRGDFVRVAPVPLPAGGSQSRSRTVMISEPPSNSALGHLDGNAQLMNCANQGEARSRPGGKFHRIGNEKRDCVGREVSDLEGSLPPRSLTTVNNPTCQPEKPENSHVKTWGSGLNLRIGAHSLKVPVPTERRRIR